jgi:glycine cleavage system transcriptional repressor
MSPSSPSSPLTYFVLTAVGTDRVGIVEDLANLVAARAGNIEESKMAVLGGEFAAVMLVAMSQADLERLEAGLASAAASLDLRLELKRTRQPEPVRDGRPYFLETVSLDTPGIVHAVTALLKQHGISIEELETETQPAPWTGAPMFRMRATLILGPQVAVARLRTELSDLGAGMDLEVSLKAAFNAPPE